MSVRQFAHRNGMVVAGFGVLLTLTCGWLIVSQARSMYSAGGVPGGAFYTIDDGKTWFEDELNKPTPFMTGGKEAVEAHVFSCDGKEFVAYLTRYNGKAKAAIEEFNAARKAGKPVDGELAKKMSFASMAGKQYKRPGDKTWVPQGQSAEISRMTAPKCDDSSLAEKTRL